jgi:hypothetical protein
LIEGVDCFLMREREAAGVVDGAGVLRALALLLFCCRIDPSGGVRGCTGGWEEDREKEED